jgi:uncharacterized metal-binding protein
MENEMEERDKNQKGGSQRDVTGGEKQSALPSCAICELAMLKKICILEDGSGARGCPTLTRQEVLKEANREYELPDIREFARQASLQEASCYANRHQRPYVPQPYKTRMQEVCEFARRMGYQRLGLAFCLGLTREARMVHDILTNHGFEVISVMCHSGRTSKKKLDIEKEDTIFQEIDEGMCNAVFQAKVLNHEKTEFNILLGLCVGHDSLFFKYAEAPTTVLAVKDRVTGHNPLAAIYLSGSYYMKLRVPEA